MNVKNYCSLLLCIKVLIFMSNFDKSTAQICPQVSPMPGFNINNLLGTSYLRMAAITGNTIANSKCYRSFQSIQNGNTLVTQFQAKTLNGFPYSGTIRLTIDPRRPGVFTSFDPRNVTDCFGRVSVQNLIRTTNIIYIDNNIALTYISTTIPNCRNPKCDYFMLVTSKDRWFNDYSMMSFMIEKIKNIPLDLNQVIFNPIFDNSC